MVVNSSVREEDVDEMVLGEEGKVAVLSEGVRP